MSVCEWERETDLKNKEGIEKRKYFVSHWGVHPQREGQRLPLWFQCRSFISTRLGARHLPSQHPGPVGPTWITDLFESSPLSLATTRALEAESRPGDLPASGHKSAQRRWQCDGLSPSALGSSTLSHLLGYSPTTGPDLGLSCPPS